MSGPFETEGATYEDVPEKTTSCSKLLDNSTCVSCQRKKRYKKRCKRHSLVCGCGWKAPSRKLLQKHRFPNPSAKLRRHLPPIKIPYSNEKTKTAGYGTIQKNKVRRRSNSLPQIDSDWTFSPTPTFVNKVREFKPDSRGGKGTKLPPEITQTREKIFRYYIDDNVMEHIMNHSNARNDSVKFRSKNEVERFVILELSLGLLGYPKERQAWNSQNPLLKPSSFVISLMPFSRYQGLKKIVRYDPEWLEKYLNAKFKDSWTFSYCVWHDSKVISFVSNFTSGCYSLSKNKKKKSFQYPEIAKIYNVFMNFVDQYDSYLKAFWNHHKKRKWTQILLYGLVKMVTVNSFIQYASVHKNNDTYEQFLGKLLNGLVQPEYDNTVENCEINENRIPLCLIKHKKNLRCKECIAKKKSSRCSYMCARCKTPLHENCFDAHIRRFHSDMDS